MKVKEIMTDAVACCTRDTPLQEAARLMAQNDCGALPVVEDKSSMKLTGIITDRDIVVRCLATGKSPTDAKVGDCMTPRVVSTKPEADLREAERLMEQNQVRRIPVIDDRSKACVGIVSQADIAIRAPEKEVAEVVREVSQPARRA